MPRTARVAPGGLVYHVLNRSVARLPLFQKPADYEAFERVLSETLPSNDTTSFTVDTLGNVLTMTQPAPNNATGTVTTTYTRDSYERVTKITWPDNTYRTFAYNTIDLPTSVTDEDNHTTATAYNLLGQVTSVMAADGGVTSYTLDLDGNVLTTQDAMGNITSNKWNSRNELVQQTLPPAATGDASPVLAWTYDNNGNELTYTRQSHLIFGSISCGSKESSGA